MPAFPWVCPIIDKKVSDCQQRRNDVQAERGIVILGVGCQNTAGHHRCEDEQIDQKGDKDRDGCLILDGFEGL